MRPRPHRPGCSASPTGFPRTRSTRSPPSPASPAARRVLTEPRIHIVTLARSYMLYNEPPQASPQPGDSQPEILPFEASCPAGRASDWRPDDAVRSRHRAARAVRTVTTSTDRPLSRHARPTRYQQRAALGRRSTQREQDTSVRNLRSQTSAIGRHPPILPIFKVVTQAAEHAEPPPTKHRDVVSSGGVEQAALDEHLPALRRGAAHRPGGPGLFQRHGESVVHSRHLASCARSSRSRASPPHSTSRSRSRQQTPLVFLSPSGHGEPPECPPPAAGW